MNKGFKVTTQSDEEEYTVKQVDTPKELEYESDTEFNPMLKFLKFENGEVILNKEELFFIPEAKVLLAADKGGMVKGDVDGRGKRWAFKQFGVAWWMVNTNSPGIQSGLEGTALVQDALKSLQIEHIEWDWKNDTPFINFLTIYKRMYKRAAYSEMLKQMLMSFNDTSEIIKLIRDSTTKILRSDKVLDADDVKILMGYQREIINLTGDIPKQIDKLKNLQELVTREEKNIEIGRGGVTITKSMQPD
ncbi:unnamed protein product [marine sediment metagenome]|uniref:Uncharacterized protein n=1 Tax=marine sediment metagenome TaxID=412755 RepID=X0SQ58_9ZZZZ